MKLNRAKRSKRELKAEKGSENLTSTLSELYSVFNREYYASDREIDKQSCSEALEGTRALLKDPLTANPETMALLSYMLLQSSKIPAMTGVSGRKRELKYQNRKLWDKALIDEGLEYLNKSAEGSSVSIYHLKAAVSACHSLAKDHRSTDLRQIQSLYDRYLEFNNSVEIALERAEVISSFKGARAQIKAIEEIIINYSLDAEHPLHEKLGNLYSKLHDYKAALNSFEKALRLTQSKSDKSIYRKKIKYCKMRLNYRKKYALGLSF